MSKNTKLHIEYLETWIPNCVDDINDLPEYFDININIDIDIDARRGRDGKWNAEVKVSDDFDFTEKEVEISRQEYGKNIIPLG